MFRGKESWQKNDLKFRVKFARKILDKNSADFWEEGVGFCLDGTRFSHKRIFFYKPGETLGKDLIQVSLENVVTTAQERMLLTLWQQLHMERAELQGNITMVE